MGTEFENTEDDTMMCHVCGADMTKLQTNIPFKVSQTTIVIVKDLPRGIFVSCGSYIIPIRLDIIAIPTRTIRMITSILTPEWDQAQPLCSVARPSQ